MKTRIYRVGVRFPNGDQSNYLVEATSRSQAERHVAAKFISAEVASPQNIVALMTNGAKVETAKADTETADLPLNQ
jgi:hypothetical protein